MLNKFTTERPTAIANWSKAGVEDQTFFFDIMNRARDATKETKPLSCHHKIIHNVRRTR